MSHFTAHTPKLTVAFHCTRPAHLDALLLTWTLCPLTCRPLQNPGPDSVTVEQQHRLQENTVLQPGCLLSVKLATTQTNQGYVSHLIFHIHLLTSPADLCRNVFLHLLLKQ